MRIYRVNCKEIVLLRASPCMSYGVLRRAKGVPRKGGLNSGRHVGLNM